MLIIFVILVLALAACSSGGHSGGVSNGHSSTPMPRVTVTVTSPPADDEPAPEERPAGEHRVTFAIRGGMRRAAVSYTTPDGVRRRLVVAPPWSRTFSVKDGRRVDVAAHGSGSGDLTCTLTVDGELVKSASSSGDSANVECGDEIGF
jgi:hypothetical protein